MRKKQGFYNELFLPKEIDSKNKEINSETATNSELFVLTETPEQSWSGQFSIMLHKIANLIGFSEDEFNSIEIKSPLSITQALQYPKSSIFLCFLPKSTLNKLPFNRSKSGFTKIANHRIIFLPKTTIFIEHQKSKQFLWKAIVEEFPESAQ